MRALFFDNQDYLIEILYEEFLALRETRLETSLTHAFEQINLGKEVSLEFGENKQEDGIELKHVPENAWNWEEIQRIQIKINERAYSFVRERGTSVTRYGLGAKIEIQIVQEYSE